MRNPLSLAALAADEVKEHGRFKTYVAFGQQGDVQTGTFVSEVSRNEREEFVVNITTDDNPAPRTVELCTLGITPSNEGVWSPGRVTIELEADID